MCIRDSQNTSQYCEYAGIDAPKRKCKETACKKYYCGKRAEFFLCRSYNLFHLGLDASEILTGATALLFRSRRYLFVIISHLAFSLFTILFPYEVCDPCRTCSTSSFRYDQDRFSCSSWCCNFSACILCMRALPLLLLSLIHI